MSASSTTQEGTTRRKSGRPAGASAVATRRRILAAALKLFGQWGYDATRIKDVALKAGVNAALVHHYFGDKDDLYQAVLADALKPLKVLGQKLLLKGLPTEMLLAAWVEVLSSYFHRHRDVLWLVTRECMGNARRIRGTVVEALGPIFQATVDALREDRKDTNPDVDAAYLVVNTLGMVAVWHTHGTLVEQVLGHEVSSEKQRARQVEQIMALVQHGALRKS
ncbi:MAG: TetR/AcrR family transcriptional regulator [Myxococcota bacterium]